MYSVIEDGKHTKFYNKKEADELKQAGEDVYSACYDIATATWSGWRPYRIKEVRGGHKPLLSYKEYKELRFLRDVEDFSLQALSEKFNVSYRFIWHILIGENKTYKKYERKFQEEII